MILDPEPTAPPAFTPLSGIYKEPVGNLIVTSDPSGADVYLDDIYIGITPLKHIEIPRGLLPQTHREPTCILMTSI
jgi:hypothetical protein